MNMNKHCEELRLSHQVAPLIDVVFLLLIYFMVTSSLIKKEGDLPVRLPGPEKAPQLIIPVDAYIQLDADGAVTLSGLHFGSSDKKLEGLVRELSVLRQMAEQQQSPFFVTLDPDDRTVHGRIVDVLDACAAAKVKNMTFARSDT